MFCYIHIPFCTSKCKYCRFASFWNIDELKVNLYVEKLINEIKILTLTPLLQERGAFLKSIYFWGWTPSVLSIKQLELIIITLREKYWFDESIEINIEATPVTLTENNIIWWKQIWVNRISSWVQTLNNDSLIEIWRGEKWDIIKWLDNIKKVWFDNVSIDFIIWLPFVKKWEIKRNIESILDSYSFIKHISVYMLEEYYEVSEKPDSKFENITYPNDWNKLGLKDEEYLWEYIEIKQFLAEKWFNSYEISNLSKKWYECKHNNAYWNHSSMLAYWLWAHGFIDNTRFSNSENFIEYYTWKNRIIEKLSDNDIFLEKVMFWLRTSGLSFELYNKLNQNKIEEFIKLWYILKKSDKIILSDKWILLMDYILKEII